MQSRISVAVASHAAGIRDDIRHEKQSGEDVIERLRREVCPAEAPVAGACRWLAVFAWGWLLFATPFLTDAACFIFVGFFLGVTWWALAAPWLYLGCTERECLCSPAGRRWWLAAGAALCLGPLLAFTDCGLAARVALCRPSLEGYAGRVPRGAQAVRHAPRRVGLFRVDGTEEQGGAVVLCTSVSLFVRHGLVYLPPGAQPPSHLSNVRHLVGDWYGFDWRWMR